MSWERSIDGILGCAMVTPLGAGDTRFPRPSRTGQAWSLYVVAMVAEKVLDELGAFHGWNFGMCHGDITVPWGYVVP